MGGGRLRKGRHPIRARERDRSACFLDALPKFTSGCIRLLDNPRLVSQFVGLERRTSPGGRDSVTHGVSGSDDAANAVAIAATIKTRAPMVISPEAMRRLGVPEWKIRFPSSPTRPRAFI